MDIQTIKEFFDSLLIQETWLHLREMLPIPGFLFGILFPFIEAIFPPLPIFVIGTVNVFLFGFWPAVLYTWIGSTLGALFMYGIFYHFRKRFLRIENRFKKLKHGIEWVNSKGFWVYFALLSFPFTPTMMVSALAGLSGQKVKQYALALILGIGVRTILIGLFGNTLFKNLDNTKVLVIIIAIGVFISFIGNKLYKKLNIHKPKD